MDSRVESEVPLNPEEENVPSLIRTLLSDLDEKPRTGKAISLIFQSKAHLANLLPTGSVLAFQLLSPIFTNQGECDIAGQRLTTGLISLCAISCLLLTFTDSFKDQNGDLCYGFATTRGLWVIDGPRKLPAELAARHRVQFTDFIHAFMPILVFVAIALFDQNVVKCFYPSPSDQAKELLKTLPVCIVVICSILFVVFPTHRHGIGFPITSN